MQMQRNGLSRGMVLFLCLVCLHVAAQEPADSTRREVPSSFIGTDSSVVHRTVVCYILSDLFPTVSGCGEADTSVTGTYRQESLLHAKDIYTAIATIGQAHKSLNFQAAISPGFRYKTMPYPCYRRTLEQWRFNRVDGVYTLLRYEWRNGQENSFDVEHAQQVGNFRYNLAFQTRLSEGVYVNEGVRDVNFGFQGLQRSDSSRYGFDVSFIYNLFYLHESGGIANDADYMANLEPRAISVNTPSALNNYSDNDFRYRHWFHIGSRRDSSRMLLPSRLGYLTHQFQLKSSRSLYTDNSLGTSDSVSGRIIRNQIGWTNREPCSMGDSSVTMFFGVSHDHIRNGDSLQAFRSYVFALNAAIDLPLKRAGIWKNRLTYAFSGYNANDFDVRSCYTLPLRLKKRDSLTQNGFFQLSLHYVLSEPDYFFRHYVSNGISWDNPLQKQQLLQAEAMLDWKGCQAAVRSFTLGNHVYLNEQLAVNQLSEPIHVMQGELLLPLRWKGFGADLHGYLQRSSSDSLHLPALVTRNSVFYGFPLFHQAAYLQLGIEAICFTAYYADAYQPSMQQFYHQNSTLVGNDLYLGAFLNARIEHFHAYFACANILSAMDGFYPFQFPHYPAKGLNFRFGISWRFYD